MAEQVNDEVQRVADLNAAMRQALDERQAEADAALQKRRDEIYKDIVKAREKAAKG